MVFDMSWHLCNKGNFDHHLCHWFGSCDEPLLLQETADFAAMGHFSGHKKGCTVLNDFDPCVVQWLWQRRIVAR